MRNFFTASIYRSPARLKNKGKVLAVKTGSNPNSSSLGVDVTLLLAAGAAAGLLSFLGGTLVRWVKWRKDRGGGN